MKKRKVILGAGESGVGAALLAKAKGFETFVSDSGSIAVHYRTILKKNDIDFEEGTHDEEFILGAEEIIKSPGIPDSIEIIIKAKEKSIPVISEIEFAYRYSNARFITITGTNGKTTTTMLTYHLLKKAGLNVGLGGNIGTSLAKQVIDEKHEIYVLEISSFQLDGMFSFKSDIAILLNITPDHLNRYDYQMSNYTESKFRVCRNMTSEDHFIYFSDSELISKEVEKRDIKAQLLPISLTDKVQKGAYYEKGNLVINLENDSINQFIIKEDDIILKGSHNMINSMAAGLAAKLMGATEDQIKAGLKDFKNAAHRLEPIATINGVLFVNDSKATNVDSVFYALGSYKQKLIWIAGGQDKGNDYNQIKDLVSEKVKALVCLGKENGNLISFFSDYVSEIRDTDNVKEAVREAFSLASPGDVVLLSPACASFDLFKNYEDRGNQFKEAVRAMSNNEQ